MVRFADNLTSITPDMLTGFFEGWPNPPSCETHCRILQNSTHVVLAIDDNARQVVGFVNAISDGVLFAYIPLLEVLPEYRGKGIGRELTRRMLAKLKDIYTVDLLCDKDLQPFYAACGMSPATGMMLRNYGRQSGAGPASGTCSPL